MAQAYDWIDAAVGLQQFCERYGYPFAFIGGVAIQRWGDPRVTQDVDLTLFTGFSGEEEIVDRFLAEYPARVSGAREFALTRRVMLLQTKTGIGLDIALGGLPFEGDLVKRASLGEYLPGVFLRTCSAEDLIVMKVFAGRPRDWSDVERVIIRQTGKLDWGYIERQLQPLLELKEDAASLPRLRELRTECEQ